MGNRPKNEGGFLPFPPALATKEDRAQYLVTDGQPTPFLPPFHPHQRQVQLLKWLESGEISPTAGQHRTPRFSLSPSTSRWLGNSASTPCVVNRAASCYGSARTSTLDSPASSFINSDSYLHISRPQSGSFNIGTFTVPSRSLAASPMRVTPLGIARLAVQS